MVINKIVRSGLCIGCGLCQSVFEKERCEMKLFSNGFYYPVISNIDLKDYQIKKICPGIKEVGDSKQGLWGHIAFIAEAWSSDRRLRYKAASGGVASSLAISLLENKHVDAVLQTGVRSGQSFFNELKISTTREDILSNAQSRYAPVLTLSNLKQILDKDKICYAFIGKPCDIVGIKNFMKAYPQYSGRIKFTISIFCGGMPSYVATKELLANAVEKNMPKSIKYRGEGWPGCFSATWDDGSVYEESYSESWGKILSRKVGFRCKICPDGIGMLADIALGDAWNTKNGYPDFNEDDGRNFCMVRTEVGEKVFNEAFHKGYIVKKVIDESKIRDMQPYQYSRRLWAPWRIIAANILSKGIINFKGLGLLYAFFKSDKQKGLQEMHGTIVRMMKSKRKLADISAINDEDL